ncbi:hypothetical protein BpHYR1_027154 [Brachionus plicatilis]|uniref:Uncharacterized protein n=1 Tax=Brachionus plicatilis TaxID=10195 RepID=A0A3M7QFR2_BRAPC|nr:hypothetical protein BpHYR1_027154 [Brachionus plicatilis]
MRPHVVTSLLSHRKIPVFFSLAQFVTDSIKTIELLEIVIISIEEKAKFTWSIDIKVMQLDAQSGLMRLL